MKNHIVWTTINCFQQFPDVLLTPDRGIPPPATRGLASTSSVATDQIHSLTIMWFSGSITSWIWSKRKTKMQISRGDCFSEVPHSPLVFDSTRTAAPNPVQLFDQFCPKFGNFEFWILDLETKMENPHHISVTNRFRTFQIGGVYIASFSNQQKVIHSHLRMRVTAQLHIWYTF